MCGVAGIFDLKAERAIDPCALRRMAAAIAHRGPDGEGFFEAAGIGLAHRRLAIIDIAGGAQPFQAADGRNVISYNGEIYNFRDLKRDLAEVSFKTSSDTEILTEGLARHGADYIHRLRGMFAFAWFDARTRTLTLARDRFGEKPMYYAVTQDGFLVFASELRAIVASGLVPLRRSNEALRSYFLYGYVPDPLSIYEGVRKLPPASVLTAPRGDEPRLCRYWQAEFSQDVPISYDSAKAELLERFDDAVAAQTVSDAPLGAFLSGGVDSSSIVASLARAVPRITTCTIGFEEADFDERDAARITAARYGAEHQESVVRIDAASLVDRIAAIYGEPFADASALPTFEVCAAARRHVKVALSGDGGDEIFAGYRRYPFFAGEEIVRRRLPAVARAPIFGTIGRLYPKLDRAPRPLRLKTTLLSLGEDSAAAYARAMAVSLPERIDAMLSADFKNATRDCDPLAPVRQAIDVSLDPVSLARKIDFETWLPGRMLTKVDRASMANGLEVRAPFLDPVFTDWALSLPPRFLLGAEGGKRILKDAQASRVDSAILNARKRGFSPPLAKWLRAPDGPAAAFLSSQLWRQSGLFNESAVDAMLQKHRVGAGDYAQELWMLIMFDAHLRQERGAAA